MFRALNIRQKLLIALLFMGIVPLFVAMWISSVDTAKSLEQQGYQQLTSIRELKKRLLDDYFTERFADLAILASATTHLQVHNGRMDLDKVDADAHAFYTQFKELEEYYDLFLINADGYIFYSVEREPDYQTSLASGPYANSNLAKLYRKITKSHRSEIVDFASYAPSQNAPAAFIGQPILDKTGTLEMVVVLQLSIDHLNDAMKERAGLGETGETYLVGPDKLMRSDSYLDPINRTVLTSFANPEKGSVDTDASNAALAGETDTRIVIDYNGNRVLSSFTPIEIKDLTWAMMSEIDEAEALAPVAAMRMDLMMEIIVSAILVVIVAYLLAGSLVRPIREMTDHIDALSDGRGDLSVKLTVRTNDEIATLERRLNSFLEKIHGVVSSVAKTTRVIDDATVCVSQSVDKTTAGANRQHEDSHAAKIAIEELTASVQSIATSTSEARVASEHAYREINEGMAVTDKTVDVIESLSHEVANAADVIEKLNEQSKSISTVLEVIQGIAEQTNLLALNAAIEAARAGDAGRGFSVVADEVRNLAARTQSSTQQIHDIIDELQHQARHSVTVMNAGKKSADKGVEHVKHTGEYFQRITDAMSILAEMNIHIAEASERQASTAEGIHERVVHMDQIADDTANGTVDARRVNNQLVDLCHQLEGLVNQFKLGAGAAGTTVELQATQRFNGSEKAVS